MAVAHHSTRKKTPSEMAILRREAFRLRDLNGKNSMSYQKIAHSILKTHKVFASIGTIRAILISRAERADDISRPVPGKGLHFFGAASTTPQPLREEQCL